VKKTMSHLFARKVLVSAISACTIGSAVMPIAVQAQQQSSAIVGRVTDQQGQPVAGADILVVDMRSNTRRTTRSNDTGFYTVRNLAVGGPYEVRLNGVKQRTVQSISLGDSYQLSLVTGSGAIEEIIVLGQESTFSVAPGPSANFGIAQLETAVAIDRDIKDVFAIDPRINVEGGSGQVNCTGKSPRFNTTTLDGVRYGDQFGLNSNGYGTATGMPFPFDAVEQVAVEIAPFDVRYGGFSACNINAVTKRGGNEWHGSAFFEYTDEGFRGDEIDGTPFELQPYEEKFYGFSANGALIQDKLFISFAYEKQETPRILAQGFAGSGNGEERPWLSESDFNRVRDIAQNTYNYDPGSLPGDGVAEAEKSFVRLDWNINNSHQAAFVYNYYEGFEDRSSDSDDNEFEFDNHYYVKSDENTTYSVTLNSQWSDSFSTDIFAGFQEQIDGQVTVGPKDFGDHQISDVDRNTIYLGADDSRQANALSYETNYLRLNAEYLFREHAISFGYHREETEFFNLFVQHSNGGEYDYFDDSSGNAAACLALSPQERFDSADCGTTGIDKFELGRPSRIYYGSGGGTNVAADAGANFTNTLNAVFVQDDFILGDDIAITVGLRYEWWETDDGPRLNQAFTDANGFRNDATIDGTDIFMPRVGISWDYSEDLTLRGGFGLYSGGNPNVWISNSFSNDGISNAQFQFRNFDGAAGLLPGSDGAVPLSRDGRPGYDVPQSIVDDVLAVTDADANDSFLALVDPDYEQPSEWKLSIGATYDFNGWVVDVDYLYTRGEDVAYYVDVSQEQVGTTVLGKPIYDFIDGRGESNFMLTNSNQNPEAHIFSVSAQKYFDNGIDIFAGYAYTDAEDVSPMNSSVAGSNFGGVALNDIVEPRMATSNYVVPHRFTFRLGYRNTFWGDNETRFSMYSFAQEGRPQSYVMGSDSLEGDQRFGRHLLYVPTGQNDAAVVFEDSFDYAGFEAWRQRESLSTGFQKRNEEFADWSVRVDLRIDQEFPLYNDVKALGYIKLYNAMNLLNSDWGVQTSPQFFAVQTVESSVDDQGRYVFESFNDNDINDVQEVRSLWEVRLGFSVQF
jgi:hypothetical protein